MPERPRRPDLDERFKVETEDPEDALRRLLGATDDAALPEEEEDSEEL